VIEKIWSFEFRGLFYEFSRARDLSNFFQFIGAFLQKNQLWVDFKEI
jgi:hypothetical protein